MSPDPLSVDPNPSPDGDQAPGADSPSVQAVAAEDSPAASAAHPDSALDAALDGSLNAISGTPAADQAPEASGEATAAAPQAEQDDPDGHRWECRSCGFVYDPAEGVRKLAIAPGTPFLALDPAGFRCPVCRSRMAAFRDIGPRSKPSGFEENLDFGLGVNRLTPGQKNVLIFGGFALAIAFFLSLYSLR
jgi:rubredoxin